jgi:hypothetical protein
MADDTSKAKNEDAVPRTSITKAYGGAIGAFGTGFALLEFFRDDPHETFKMLGEFGPKYLLFALLAFIAWDLLKRGLKILSRGVEHVGTLASNTGKVANAVDEYAGKNDRTADEMRRLCSFSATQSERAVEVAQENKSIAEAANQRADAAHAVAVETNTLVKLLVKETKS